MSSLFRAISDIGELRMNLNPFLIPLYLDYTFVMLTIGSIQFCCNSDTQWKSPELNFILRFWIKERRNNNIIIGNNYS